MKFEIAPSDYDPAKALAVAIYQNQGIDFFRKQNCQLGIGNTPNPRAIEW